MGNKNSSSVASSDNAELHAKFQQALGKFEDAEIEVLEDTFKDLAKRSEGNTMDKQTFLRVFDLPGMLGERLFATFDIEKNGVINFAEFVSGLGLFTRGDAEQKIRFIFKMYDLTGDGKVSRTELETMLNSVVFAASVILENAQMPVNTPHARKFTNQRRKEIKDKVSALVKEAFESKNTKISDGKMSLEDFTAWIKRHPEVLEVIDTAFSGEASETTRQLYVNGHGSPDLAARVPTIDSPRLNMSLKDMLRPHSPIAQRHDLASRSGGKAIAKGIGIGIGIGKNKSKARPGRSSRVVVTSGVRPVVDSRTSLVRTGSTEYLGLRCPNCGLQIKIRFCYKCGNRLSDRTTAKLASAAKQPKHRLQRSSSVAPPDSRAAAAAVAHRSRVAAADDSHVDVVKCSHDDLANMIISNDNASNHNKDDDDDHNKKKNNEKNETKKGKVPTLLLPAGASSNNGNASDRSILGSINSSSTSNSNNNNSNGNDDRQSAADKFRTKESSHMWCGECGEVFMGGEIKFCLSCGFDFEIADKPVEPGLHHTSELQLTENEISGWLMKLGRTFKRPTERWFVLQDRFLYQYSEPRDLIPSHTTFMQGCFVETVDHSEKNPKLKWGIEIIMSEETNSRKTFYALDSEQRDEWIKALRVHAGVHPFEEFYEVSNDELGRGRFAVVYQCKSKLTGKKYAVKVVDKSSLDSKERQNLRTELAVLKLVSHRHVLQLRNVFESRTHMHIVMDLLQGGDLFDRIHKRGHFAEATVRKLMKNLLGAVQYLHARGIVHRDLKPENVMMRSEERDEDIIVGDFGFSKFTLPSEIMSIPCGTIAYVAPEVLTLSGYGFEVDVWSVGIIMYLLLCGRLPFYSEDTEKMIDLTIEGKVQFSHGSWRYVSDEAKDVILQLLKTSPSERLTAEQALEHPWFKVPEKKLRALEDEFQEALARQLAQEKEQAPTEEQEESKQEESSEVAT